MEEGGGGGKEEKGEERERRRGTGKTGVWRKGGVNGSETECEIQ